MRNRNLTILVVLLVSLVLRADSCLLEQRDVHLVLPALVPANWETSGHTEATDTDTDFVDAATPVRDAIESESLAGDIIGVTLSGITWEVLTNTGHSTRRFGGVDFTALGDGTVRILDFNIPNNDAGERGQTGDGTGRATLVAEGANELSDRLTTWFQQYQNDPASADDTLLQFTYRAIWDSSVDGDPPTAADPDNFTWVTNLILQIETVADIEVVNP